METLAEIPLPRGGRTVLAGVPGGGPTDPVALVLPAMGVPAGYYEPFARALARRDIAVAAADYPGHGRSTPKVTRRVNYGYGTLADEWLHAALDALVRACPGRPVVLLAHSMGGHVALAHLARHAHPAVVGLVTFGTASPYWKGYDSPLTILAQTQAVRAISQVHGSWPGERLGFGGRQPRGLMTEWARFSRHGRLEPRGDRSYEDGFAGIDLPVLVITLDNDTLAPQRAVDHFAAKLASARVERFHFTKDEDAPGRPVDHYSFARSPEVIDEVVADWIHASAGQLEESSTID